jgi:hypothetical protein
VNRVAGAHALAAMVAAVLGTALAAPRASADEPVAVRADAREPGGVHPVRPPSPPGPGPDYSTPRYEPAGFPFIGGDSDIGFQFGLVGTLTRFDEGVEPYLWNMDFVLSASVKGGPRGSEIAQQSALWNWDVPALMNGRVRLNPLVAYERTINDGYFGLGNASSARLPFHVEGPPARYFQFIYDEARTRELWRIAVGGPWSVMAGTFFRVVSPGVYGGSKLAEDLARNDVIGGEPLGIGSVAAGVVYDSRDDEIFPRSGQRHQASLRHSQGFPLDSGVHYEEASAIVSWFAPMGADTVFAVRGVVDLEMGHVPFYDLATGGPFIVTEMPGGSAGVRGVPVGRYNGPIKAVANAEIRTLAAPAHVLGGSFRFGGCVFADTGRVWSDYSFASRLDGSGVGLKYGAGVGAYLLWGQAAMFRLDVAYSPDAVAENPSFPVGIYVEDGTMF